MAKTKADLLADAKAAGVLAEDVEEDAFTVAELQTILAPADERPAWDGSLSVDHELVAPDGHVVLSKEDLDARRASSTPHEEE